MFVGAITLVIAIASQIGADLQEAFQPRGQRRQRFSELFIPSCLRFRSRARLRYEPSAPWLRLAAVCGLAVSLLGRLLTIYPIMMCQSIGFRRKNRCRHPRGQSHRASLSLRLTTDAAAQIEPDGFKAVEFL